MESFIFILHSCLCDAWKKNKNICQSQFGPRHEPRPVRASSLYPVSMKHGSWPLVKVFNIITSLTWASQVVRVVKNPPLNAGDAKDTGSIPGSGRLPWRRKWQPTPVLLPGKFHGQRSLAGYSPRGRQELDTAEHTLLSRAGRGRRGASICCTCPKGQAVGSLSCCPCFLSYLGQWCIHHLQCLIFLGFHWSSQTWVLSIPWGFFLPIISQ